MPGIAKFNTNAAEDFGVAKDVKLIKNPGTITSGRSVDGFLGLTETETRNNASSKDIADKLEEYVGPIPRCFPSHLWLYSRRR